MKILVVSDNHGRVEEFLQAVETEHPDRILHCGDVEGSEWELREGAGCPIDIVAGNNDYFSDLPMELELEICGKKILLAHGHNYYVYMDTRNLERDAIVRGMDIALFGHTHKPVIKDNGGILVMNPGSLSYPRQQNRLGSYGIITMQDGEVSAEIKYLEK